MIYELARGPLVWLATFVFLAGLLYRLAQLLRLTRRQERVFWPQGNVRADSAGERKLRPILSFQHSLLGQHPVMAVVSGVFHFAVFLAPVFAKGHTLLLRESCGIALWSLPLRVTEALTVLVLAGVVFMLVRRIAMPRVRAVSSLSDYALLLLVAAPYLTAWIAYHQWLPYRAVITLHMLTGEALLMAIPFTKLSHMVFFLFTRGFMESEHNVGRGDRVWSS